MLKYINTGIVFQEIPDEVTLLVNISNCPCHCPGCHSKYLWEDSGEELDGQAIDKFADSYGHDITCICFMGGDSEPSAVNELAIHVRRNHPKLKVAWYSGRTVISRQTDKQNFDYIKIGPYLKHLGSIDVPTTNQRLYKRTADNTFTDITSRFWK